MSDQTKYINKLEGKRVLVLGGTSGLGYCAAEASLEHSAIVTVSSSNPSRVSSTVSKLQSAYPSKKGNISGHACDLGSDETLESNIVSLLKTATDDGKNKLDHVIWTAADSLAVMPLPTIDIKKMHDAGRVRYFGPLLLAKHAKTYMHDSPTSSFVITTGGVADMPIPDWSVIAGYAAGLHGMTRGLALDLAPVRVNCVSPGLVDTELWKDMDAGARKQLYEMTAKGQLTGRVATPQDVAETYLYFMKDTNSTGEVLTTDGGHRLK